MRSRYLIWIGISSAVLAGLVGAAAGKAWLTARQSEDVARAMTGGDSSRAPDLIRRYGCAGCHTISGISGGDGQVGGPLLNIRKRVYIGGVVSNSPEI